MELAISFLIGRKRMVTFRNQRVWCHNWRLYYYHVKFVRFVLLAVNEEAKMWLKNFYLLDLVFVISRIIKVSLRVISLSLWLQLITPTWTSIILDITKTSSNNCLLLHIDTVTVLISFCLRIPSLQMLNSFFLLIDFFQCFLACKQALCMGYSE